jgi:hypothetical protein
MVRKSLTASARKPGRIAIGRLGPSERRRPPAPFVRDLADEKLTGGAGRRFSRVPATTAHFIERSAGLDFRRLQVAADDGRLQRERDDLGDWQFENAIAEFDEL